MRSAKTEHACAHQNRASLKNPTGRLSSRERLNARAAVHARIALHLRTQATSGRPCNTKRHFLGPCSCQCCEELPRLSVPTHQLRRRGPPDERGHLPRTNTFEATRAPASLHTFAAAHCAVRQGKRQMQSAAKEDPENLTVNARCPGRWEGGESSRCQRSVLGPQQRPPGVRQARPHHIGHEPCLRLSGGFPLPTVPRLVGLRFFLRQERRKGQLGPGGHCQPGLFHQFSALPDCLETRDTSNLQVHDHRLRNEGVSLPHRAQCVCPAGKTGGTSDPVRAREPNVAITCAPSGAEGVPKISLKHLHTEVSWRSANPSVNSGLTVLNQKLALVDPHMRRSKKAAWVS